MSKCLFVFLYVFTNAFHGLDVCQIHNVIMSICLSLYDRLLKLEILTFICSKDNTQEILRELQIHIKHNNQQFVCATIRAIGRVADADPEVADRCMEGLMHLMACNKASAVIGESVVVLRQLLQQSSGTETSSVVLHQLTRMLVGEQPVEEALARTSIVWLVGEFHDILSKIAPDILRLLAVGFTNEVTETKMQIMNFAIKLSLRLPDDGNVQSLMTYVLEMARYDLDTDLRDRSRFMTALMGLAPSNDNESARGAVVVDEEALEEFSEHAMGIMLAPKLPPVTLLGTVDVEGLPNFNLGSLSSLMGHYIAGYQPLSGWPDTQPNPNVRDNIRLTSEEDGKRGPSDERGMTKRRGKHGRSADNSSSESDSSGGKKGHDLTGFYGEKSDAESSSEEESSDSSSDSSGSESDGSEESSAEASTEVSAADSSTSESESESESDSESEEEAVVRMPLTQMKIATGTARQGMRKVVHTQKGVKGRFPEDPVDLSNMLLPSFADSPLNHFGSLSMNSDIPPGAGAADIVSADFGDDFSSMFPSAVTLDPVMNFGLSGEGMSRGTTTSSVPQQLASPYPTPTEEQLDSRNLLIGLNTNVGSGIEQQLQANQQQPQMQPQMQMHSMGMNMGQMQQQQQFQIQQQFLYQQQQQQQQPMLMGGMQNNMYNNPTQYSNNVGMSGMMTVGTNMYGGGSQGQMGSGNLQGHSQMQGQGQGQGNRSVPPPVVVEDLSEPKVILRAEMGGGLNVSLVFRYGVQAVSYMGAHCVYLIVQNSKDHAIR